jgi:type I thyroxine 5'-deiodinase
VKEAHPLDEWQMDSNEEQGVCYAQPVTFADRVAIARDFVERCAYDIPIAIDPIANPANEVYAGWPERLYVIEADGTIAYKGKTGPFGYHPEEVAAWLIRRFPPEVRPPSDVSAERIAREPLSVSALEYSKSRERWRLAIDADGQATLGRDAQAKSFEVTPERLSALRAAIADLRFFTWKESSGEPIVDGRTRSLSITLGDARKIVHVYSPAEDDAASDAPASREVDRNAPASPDVDRFERLWDLLHGFDA